MARSRKKQPKQTKQPKTTNPAVVYDTRMYFAGSIHSLFHDAQESGDFACSLAARFDSAVAGLDNLIIAWWDGSSDSRNGGSATVVDVCLPGRPKFTLEFARPTRSFGGNNVLMEIYGALNACIIIQRVLQYCQSENLLQDMVGQLEIILVTDCEAVLKSLDSGMKNSGPRERVDPILTQIKALSKQIVDFKEVSIQLDLYHCHRNRTANLQKADQLAGRARGQGMSFQCVIHHEDVGCRRPGDAIYYNNWERLNNTPSGKVLEKELEVALQQHPFGRSQKRKRIEDGLQPISSKKRKILPQPQLQPQPRPDGQAPVRRSARLLAKASGA